MRRYIPLALVAGLLAGCGNMKLGDGVIGDPDGIHISRVAGEVIALKALKRGAEICVEGKPLPFDVENPCAFDADKQAIAAKAIPYIDEAIAALEPLVDSKDQAAIDKAFRLANQARGML